MKAEAQSGREGASQWVPCQQIPKVWAGSHRQASSVPWELTCKDEDSLLPCFLVPLCSAIREPHWDLREVAGCSPSLWDYFWLVSLQKGCRGISAYIRQNSAPQFLSLVPYP